MHEIRIRIIIFSKMWQQLEKQKRTDIYSNMRKNWMIFVYKWIQNV